jgi:hypothetical protein
VVRDCQVSRVGSFAHIQPCWLHGSRRAGRSLLSIPSCDLLTGLFFSPPGGQPNSIQGLPYRRGRTPLIFFPLLAATQVACRSDLRRAGQPVSIIPPPVPGGASAGGFFCLRHVVQVLSQILYTHQDGSKLPSKKCVNRVAKSTGRQPELCEVVRLYSCTLLVRVQQLYSQLSYSCTRFNSSSATAAGLGVC